MNKILFPLIILLALSVAACSSSSDDPADFMYWSHENQAPEDIEYAFMADVVTQIYLEVNYKGGDITLICNNYDHLLPIGADGAYTYDCGWGSFTVDGRQVKCHFPHDASGKEEAVEQITISAKKGRETVSTILLVKRSFGELSPYPDSDELPDKYKFKLVRGALMPFMNDDFTVPAPFDNVSYKITDYLERFQAFGFPEFTEPYDSIVWSADGFPDTVRIYERSNTSSSSAEHFSSQWSTHFFRSGEIKNHLKGYRDGKVIYSTSLTTLVVERDFLCYDWTAGSVVLLNPGTSGVYCPLETRYEYSAAHTLQTDGTRYAHISVRNTNSLSEAEFAAFQQEALEKLMAVNIGQGVSAAAMTESFKCLPAKGVEALKYWENKTTRILLLHKLPDEEYTPTKYYLHFEAK